MLSVERKHEIRELRLTLTAVECKREKKCCVCGGPLSPGDWEVRIDSGAAAHTHCCDDLEVDV